MNSISKLVGDDNVLYVFSCMLSIELYRRKYGVFPPAAHDSELDLLFWAQNFRRFEERQVSNLSIEDAKWIVDPNNFYDAVWVRVGFDGYRKAMIWHGKTYGATENSIASLDADHVINRANLMKQFGEDSWTMLFPVTAASNRSFGASIEKSKFSVGGLSGEIPYPALHLIKTHVFSRIKDKGQLKLALKDMRSFLMLDSEAEKDALLETAEQIYADLRRWE